MEMLYYVHHYHRHRHHHHHQLVLQYTINVAEMAGMALLAVMGTVHVNGKAIGTLNVYQMTCQNQFLSALTKILCK